MSAFKFGSWMKKIAADPMAAQKALNAQRVAQMKSMANQVRNASGTPNPTGNGTHRWSGVVRGGNVSNAQYTPPSSPSVQAKSPAVQPQPQSSMAEATSMLRKSRMGLEQRMQAAGMNTATTPGSYTPPQPKVTTTPVDGAALAKQVQQMQQQPAAPTPPPPAPSAATPSPNSAGSWANQTNNPNVPQPPSQPQSPTMFQRMSNAYNAFRGATPGAAATPAAPAAPAPQAQPSHIITTDNGRQFDTINKRFLDGRPGGFAR